MKNRYFKRDTVYTAFNKGIEVTAYIDGQNISISTEVLGAEWHLKAEYEEITRTEFMEAYLPIAEKMNNKIGEL